MRDAGAGHSRCRPKTRPYDPDRETGEWGTLQMAFTTVNCNQRSVLIYDLGFRINEDASRASRSQQLTPSSAAFLDRSAPSWMGGVVEYLAVPEMMDLFLDNPAAYVRNGGSIGLANNAPDHPIWVKFARAMGRVSLIAMAVWTLKPDKLDENQAAIRRVGAFVATVIAFFVAEIGDKTQLATVALAAAYTNLAAVVSGTTLGMLLANAPAIFLGHAFADRLPLKMIRYGAAVLFTIVGLVFLLTVF